MIALLAGLAMFAQDFFLTWKSLFANRGHPVWAGLFDMLGGFMVVATIGISTTTAIRHGLSLQTALVFVAMGIADFSADYLATRTGKWIHAENLTHVIPTPKKETHP